jgi:hypothetical protein
MSENEGQVGMRDKTGSEMSEVVAHVNSLDCTVPHSVQLLACPALPCLAVPCGVG